jgi:hypothetical protein
MIEIDSNVPLPDKACINGHINSQRFSTGNCKECETEREKVRCHEKKQLAYMKKYRRYAQAGNKSEN